MFYKRKVFLFILIVFSNILNAQTRQNFDTFYTDRSRNKYSVFFPTDYSNPPVQETIKGIKRTIYDLSLFGPFTIFNPTLLRINDTIKRPYIFSSDVTFHNTDMIYQGIRDTLIGDKYFKGFFFREMISLGVDCYALSCYDLKYLTPILHIQFTDNSFKKWSKIYVNLYPENRGGQKKGNDKIPKLFMLTKREQKLMIKASPFGKSSSPN